MEKLATLEGLGSHHFESEGVVDLRVAGGGGQLLQVAGHRHGHLLQGEEENIAQLSYLWLSYLL